MNSMEGNEGLFRQIDELLAQIDPANFDSPVQLFEGATLGQHFRHILNFYQSILSGLERGHIDYASRVRDPFLEKNPALIRQAFQKLSGLLRNLDESMPVFVLTDYHADARIPRQKANSSIGRELMYAFDHAIHHLAIIRMGLSVVQPELAIPASLGIAPSTLKYHQNASGEALG